MSQNYSVVAGHNASLSLQQQLSTLRQDYSTLLESKQLIEVERDKLKLTVISLQDKLSKYEAIDREGRMNGMAVDTMNGMAVDTISGMNENSMNEDDKVHHTAGMTKDTADSVIPFTNATGSLPAAWNDQIKEYCKRISSLDAIITDLKQQLASAIISNTKNSHSINTVNQRHSTRTSSIDKSSIDRPSNDKPYNDKRYKNSSSSTTATATSSVSSGLAMIKVDDLSIDDVLVECL